MTRTKLNGSITIFIALSLAVISSLIGTLIYSARLEGARTMVAQAARLALGNSFAQFETELLDCYGVLLWDGAGMGNDIDKTAIAQKIKEDMSFNLDTDKGFLFMKSQDFYEVCIDSVDIDECITPEDAYGLVWRTMADSYEKLDYPVSLIEELLGINQTVENNSKVMEVIEKTDEGNEKAAFIMQQYLQLIQCIDGVKVSIGGIDFSELEICDSYVKKLHAYTGSEPDMELLSIRDERIFPKVKESSVDAQFLFMVLSNDFNLVINGDKSKVAELVMISEMIRDFIQNQKDCVDKAMRLIESIQGETVLLGIEKIALESILDDSKEELGDELKESLEAELEQTRTEWNSIEDRALALGEIYEVLKADKDILGAAYSHCVDMDDLKRTQNLPEDANEYQNSYQETLKLLRRYRSDGMYLDYSDLACQKPQDIVLGRIYDYATMNIQKLVLPEGAEVSDKKIAKGNLAVDYGIKGNRGEYIEDYGTDLMNEMIFNLYIAGHYSNFCSVAGKEGLDYGLEYIIFGKRSDKDNLNAAIASLAGVRLAANTLSVFTDIDKKQQALGIATAALGFTGIYPLVKALEYTILTAWAIGETIIDLRMLFDGKKVPVIKHKDEWKLTFENLIAGNLDVSQMDNEKGLEYKDYLMAMLFDVDGRDKAYRSMTMAELHMMMAGVDNFRLKNYIYGIDMTVKYHINGNSKIYTEHCSYAY